MRPSLLPLAVLGALLSCSGKPPPIDRPSPDAGAPHVRQPAPQAWTCDPSQYDDGAACHTNCGARDPDCDNPSLPTPGCPFLPYQHGSWTAGSTGNCVPATCGNHALDLYEGCEDGNDVAGDGCFECLVERGYACDNSSLPSKCHLACGDGIPQHDNASQTYEHCDDGNNTSGDGCESDCMSITPGYGCDNTKSPSLCTRPPAGWTCDPAAYTDGTCYCGCGVKDPDCATTGTSACWYPLGCLTDVTRPETATTVPDPTDNSRCVPNTCGDGFAANHEECDDGNTTDGDGCSSACRIEVGYDCLNGGFGASPTAFSSVCKQVPAEWLAHCLPWEYLDDACTCGCSVEDPACPGLYGPDWRKDPYESCLPVGQCDPRLFDPKDPTQCLMGP